MTPSEQERDALESLANALSWLPPEVVVEPDALDQYRLAVRRAVVAEAVAVVEAEATDAIDGIEPSTQYRDGRRDGIALFARRINDALTALRGLSPEGE